MAIQIDLAESAGPPVAKDAAIYVLGPRGYTPARNGRNGFTCLISRERPDTLEPECFDAEGTATVVPVRMFYRSTPHALMIVVPAPAAHDKGTDGRERISQTKQRRRRNDEL